jgi:stage IV sporulation protein FB
MEPHQGVLHWSLSLGTWFAIRVRVSVFFPLIALILCHRLEDVPVGLTVTLALFIAVLLHEIGHVFGARLTGGDGEEVVITPIGGLAPCLPAPTFSSHLWTVAAGPLVNAGLCLITLLPVLESEVTRDLLDPFIFPASVKMTGSAYHIATAVLPLIVFKVNWLLLLINLIPVHPLDGGRILQIILNDKLDAFVARRAYLMTGAIFGVLMLMLGLFFDNTWVMAIAAVVLPMNVAQTYQSQAGTESEESFLGYDFSEGYTSFDRSAGSGEPEDDGRPGMLDRWRAQREEERLRRQEEDDREMERRLDELLAKLHVGGEASLSSAEKRQLREISDRIRNRKS